jgi:cytochrome oxidase assembly protein ShyY1
VIWPLLRTRRWIGFTAVVVLAIIAFGLLSAWQWARAEERRAERTALESALGEQPVTWPDAADLVRKGEDWVPVQVTGTFTTNADVVVRKRPLNARNGFWVLTPLATPAGALWVNRGWIPAGPDAFSTPDLPAPPPGEVTVTGLMRMAPPADPERNLGLPPGQVSDPDPRLLPRPGAFADGYLQLTSSDPAQQDLTPLGLPEIDDGRNISYAVQWALFALVAMSGWYYFLRREAAESAPADPVDQPLGTR